MPSLEGADGWGFSYHHHTPTRWWLSAVGVCNDIKNVLSSAKRSQHVFWSVIFEGCEHEKRVVICKKITTCFLRSYCWKMTTYFICCHLPFLTLFLRCHLYKDLNAYIQVSSFSTDQNTDYVATSCSNHAVRNVFSSFTDHNALLGFWLTIFYR